MLTVFLTGNSIQKIKLQQSVGFTNLVTLDLCRNGLETIEDLNLPHLRHLFLVKKKMHVVFFKKKQQPTIFPVFSVCQHKYKLTFFSGPKQHQVS